LLIHAHGTFPNLSREVLPPPAFDKSTLPLAAQAGWQWADAADAIDDSETARERWQELHRTFVGTPWEPVAALRLGRSLFRLGRTPEARLLFEGVAAAEPALAGETGLPLDVLALRSLLELSEVDRSAGLRREAWLNELCHRVLLRWRLPRSLLDDAQRNDPALVGHWQALVGVHEQTRAAFGLLLGSGAKASDVPQEGWVVVGESSHLLTRVEVSGGLWLLLWPEATLRQRVQEALATHGLDAHLGAHVAVGGRALSDAPDRGEELASASNPLVSVALHLARPDLLLSRQRLRAWIFGTLIALAAVAVVAGFLTALLACERQSQFAEMQGAFVASVTHELRAPLAAIRLMAEELTDLSPELQTRRAEYHRLILRESHRLGMLIENVLRHARLERETQPLTLERVDVGAVVRESIEGLEPCALERAIHVEAHVPEQPVIVPGDEQALRQVLVNLLDNALKHSPAGATVTVGIDLEDEHPTARRAQLWVADEGAGIPAAEQNRIFESFYRQGTELRRETPGVGLGLAIVKRLVEAHGGTVSLVSSPGAGCRFTIDLPVT
jgi:signal transduction histidine kinase